MLGMLVFCTVVSIPVMVAVYSWWAVDVRKRAMVMTLCVDDEQEEPIIERGPIANRSNVYLAVLLLLMLCLCFYYLNVRTDTKIVIAVILGASGILASQRLKQRNSPSKAVILRQISYELPLVMERIVMAVQAGHDILPALKIVLECGEKGAQSRGKSYWVLKSIREVVDAAEAGMTLQSSLRMASQKTNSTSLRHALLHIAVAHEQGGGLLFALSELADATQSYYQESVEEQIATLPVKATLPLVVVFGGLLIILLTSPIIQTLDTTASYGAMK